MEGTHRLHQSHLYDRCWVCSEKKRELTRGLVPRSRLSPDKVVLIRYSGPGISETIRRQLLLEHSTEVGLDGQLPASIGWFYLDLPADPNIHHAWIERVVDA